MSQHFSDARATLPRRNPDNKHVRVLYIPDLPVHHGSVTGLRTAGPNSEVVTYKAVPDGNGGFKRDKAGHLLLGKRIKGR